MSRAVGSVLQSGGGRGRRDAVVRRARLTAAAVSVAAAARATASLRVNFTSSLPLGIYRSAPAGRITHGSVVLVCLPEPIARFARGREYLWRGECPGPAAPIGKLVLALAGDTVGVTAGGLRLNGFIVPRTQPLGADRKARPMVHYPYGDYVVPADRMWLYSPYDARSFDSRYFGPVPVSSVRSTLVSVWTTTP